MTAGVVLKSSQNSAFGNIPFDEKLPTYQKSGFLWTKGLKKFGGWGTAEINERQASMAKNATKIWSLKP
jgi:hypothetical protein